MPKNTVLLCFLALFATLLFASSTFGAQCVDQIVFYEDYVEVHLEDPIENPDGSQCCFDHNEEGPYGDRGVYRCEDADGNSYTGYGAPR